VQTLHALTSPLRGIPRLRDRYGDAFTINHPIFGRTVVISDAAEIRQLFLTSPDIADNIEPNLGRVLGPGSLFALHGEAHRRQRKLLVPPFHGRRLAAYEQIVEDETVCELAAWPQDRPFATMPSMMRITLNAILRAVFGAEGAEFRQLRELLPRMVALGSRLALLPIPRVDLGWWSPWGRFWAMRRRYDAIVESLLTRAARDDDLDGRDDILAMMLQSRYDDGSTMGHGEIADQLLTLLSAGHETTATTLAWAVERLRRHPGVLRTLVDEVDAGGDALRQATIIEVQRTRPVIDIVGRKVRAESLQLGRWALPRSSTSSWASRSSMTTSQSSRTRTRSTRSGSSTRSRTCTSGSRSAAEPGVASARRSPRWR
jgi:cytochrome P450